MTNRICERLSQLKTQGRKALATYIVSGDPHPDVTLAAMHTLVKSGADILELGVPFSDPMAEGPVIQLGHERALEHHTSLCKTFELVQEFRQEDQSTPVVLMGYANPIERMGYSQCAQRAADAGVDGILTVDLPAEEAGDLNHRLRAHGIENIFLVAPTTTESRIRDIVALAGGFIYYVSLKGVTGAGHLDVTSVKEKLKMIKEHTFLPLLVGFGIKDTETAAAVAKVSDGVVIGSVLVEAMGQDINQDSEAICARLAKIVVPMRDALDQSS